MSLSASEASHILLALAILLAATHATGFIFQLMRQPVVVGEILGGLLLGPSCFGYFFPELSAQLFKASLPTQTVLAALSQMGLIFLMFASGLEVRTLFNFKESKTTLSISIMGCIIPFALGSLYVLSADQSSRIGTANNLTAFLIIFSASIAVTSIPVISRIFIDLKIMNSSLARVVLASALLEDIALYVALGVALGLVAGVNGELAPFAVFLGLTDGSAAIFLYHLLTHSAFLLLCLFLGPRAFSWISQARWNLLARRSPIGFLLVAIFLVTALAASLGISLMFGAFCVGSIVGAAGDASQAKAVVMKDNALGFSIPIYFGMVGFKLNLIKSFQPLDFILLLIFACLVKAGSVYGGARLAGEVPRRALHLAVCMNARGGPGIVLASVAFQAQIINESFYVSLVLLAIMTSLGAGTWLERALRKGESLS